LTFTQIVLDSGALPESVCPDLSDTEEGKISLVIDENYIKEVSRSHD